MFNKITYPVYHSGSGWHALLPARAPRQELPGSPRARTIVVGAGYTGLATARRLAELEPDQEVLVLEAGCVGEGASGRNSGFLSSMPKRPRAGPHGSAEDEAWRQMRIYQAGTAWLRDLVQQHGIDCDWDEQSPRFSAAATEAGAASLKGTLAKFRRWGVDCEQLDRDALRMRIGTGYYQFGYYAPRNTFVQPAALIRGLADSLPRNVRLAEQTPVLRLEHGRSSRVHTRSAVYECDRLVIANNGFARMLGLLRDRMFTIYTYAGLTAALSPEERSKLGVERKWGVIPAHRLGSTLRLSEGGRFMVRSGYSYEKELSTPQVHAMLSGLYRNRFPHMASFEFEHVWGGATAVTLNGGSFFGQVRPGVYASVGCNGAGVLRGSTQGRLLADLMCGQDSDLLSDQLKLHHPNWIPPEPFRAVGVASVLAMERRKAGAER
ncbi:FAD-binding oxidoreductase [Bordetella sp. BOR01]|uniref:NAD(P)/FAD-dependent oxidoreductase n=1 Tax=Bordetella sp. BOR01 TaxID=2854779 RepID=UPI001C468EED|nr:FAD-binding oxidoreductase [Bordetella sp. BOR01]MBV7483461.1 FAD-binding oxidoreductase [Bordetella sp. BOR01]